MERTNWMICSNGTGFGAEVQYPGRKVQYHFLLGIMLENLTTLYSTWSNKKELTPSDLATYSNALRRFTDGWLALKWKPALWVHWICAHSTFFLNQHRTLSAFSSIPTEFRHQKFKRDLKNTAQCFKYLNPERCRAHLQRVIELDALDMGLAVLQLKPPAPRENVFEPSESSLGKRKRI